MPPSMPPQTAPQPWALHPHSTHPPAPTAPICCTTHPSHILQKHPPSYPSSLGEICEISAEFEICEISADFDDAPSPNLAMTSSTYSDASTSTPSSYDSSPFDPDGGRTTNPCGLPSTSRGSSSIPSTSSSPHNGTSHSHHYGNSHSHSQNTSHDLAAFLHQLSLPTSRIAFFAKGLHLTPELCWELSDFIACTPSLRMLTLSSTHLTDPLLDILLPALAATTSLATLDLPGNNLTDAGAAQLAGMLKANRSITELQLNRNQIGSAGAAALAEALQCNSRLAIVNLADNCITDRGAEALVAAARAKGSGVKSLQVTPGNSLSADVAAELARGSAAGKRVRQFLKRLTSQ